MQGMIRMNKKDLIEFINKNFSENHENDTIATFYRLYNTLVEVDDGFPKELIHKTEI